eukprot:COSAG02_NODE_975_length_15507_cov_14.829180_13_plen_152_part_00
MAERPAPAAVLRLCREANEVAKEAVAAGSHPFGAVLASETGEVLLRQGNIDTVNHAESTLARQAYREFSFEQLQKCTLYSTFEPCAVSALMYSPVRPSPACVFYCSFGGAACCAWCARADVRSNPVLGWDRRPLRLDLHVVGTKTIWNLPR